MAVQMISGMLLQHVTFQIKFILYVVHFSCGLTVLILTLFRTSAFFTDKRPAKPLQVPYYHKKFIQAIHIGFYCTLLLLGFTGIAVAISNKLLSALALNDSYTLDIGAIGLSKIIHGVLVKVFLLLLIIHVSGVFTHWIRFKENRLRTLKVND